MTEYLQLKVQKLIEIVIKKGGGIRPFEALATLVFRLLRNQEGAKFYFLLFFIVNR